MTTEPTADDRSCPPALALERYLDSTIDSTTSASWKDHIDGCERCQTTLAEMRAEGARFVASPAFERARPQPPKRWRRVWPILAVAATIAIAFVGRPDGWQSKGAVVFAVVDAGGNHGPFEPGTMAQLVLTNDESEVVCVLAREPSGEVSVLFGPERTNAGARVRLGDGFVLESKHDGTVFWLFTDDTDLDAKQLEADVERGGGRRARASVRLEVNE